MPSPVDILNQMNVAVLTVNRKHRITFMNYAAESLIGYSRLQTLDHDLDEFFDLFPIEPRTFNSVLESYQSFTLREIAMKPLGQQNSIKVNVTLSPLDTDEVILEVEPMDRILQISREDLIYSSLNASKSLIRGLAHEIRNPLGGIRGAAQLLDRELRTVDQKEFTKVIIDEADRLHKLVDRLLGPTNRLKHEPFNIHEVIERVLKLSSLDDRSKQLGIVMHREYDPSLPETDGEADHILQAILNIVTNALDALEDTSDPHLIVRTKIVRHFTIGGNQHRICMDVQIENNGPMIPPELQHQIFLPLISAKERGSGLGLAIAQNIIQAHGGLISCESEPTFTRFHVYLPVSSENTANDEHE